MERFLVSARKYRPVRFSDVVGQEHVTNTLKNAIRSGQVAQAFLFCGPRGVGKTTCARILAQAINCQNITPDTEPCGECPPCLSFRQTASFNVHELDAASNNSVEDIRSLIEQVRYMPQEGKYKIYIIDEVHMLSQQAFNAFLKTLEEPPPYAIFILATTEKHKIIPTILSRCQIFDFNRIGVKYIVTHLEEICGQEKISFEKDALHIIAQKADGALRDALSLFDRLVIFGNGSITLENVLENLSILDYDYYFKLTDALLEADSSRALILFDEITSRGFEGDIFLNGLAQHFRDLLICRSPETLNLLEVSGGLVPQYQAQAQNADPSFLLKALSIASQFDLSYRTSRNKKLHVELALLKMAQLPILTEEKESTQYVKKKSSAKEIIIERKQKEVAPPPPSPMQSSVPEIQIKPEPKPAISTHPEPLNPTETASSSFTKNPSLGGRKLTDYNELEKQLLTTGNEIKAAPVMAPVSSQIVEERKSAAFKADPEELKRVWPLCIGFFEADNKVRLVAVLKKYNPAAEANGEISIEVESKLDMEIISEFRTELNSYLRQELGTPQLSLVLKVKLDAGKNRPPDPYTPKEKFERMKEKNPTLQEFKDQLGLELDF